MTVTGDYGGSLVTCDPLGIPDLRACWVGHRGQESDGQEAEGEVRHQHRMVSQASSVTRYAQRRDGPKTPEIARLRVPPLQIRSRSMPAATNTLLIAYSPRGHRSSPKGGGKSV